MVSVRDNGGNMWDVRNIMEMPEMPDARCVRKSQRCSRDARVTTEMPVLPRRDEGRI